MAVGYEENEENDPTDQRDEAEEHPPAAASGVVEAADGEGEAGKEDGQSVEYIDRSVNALAGETEDVVDQIGQNGRDDVENEKHPVGFAAAAAGEGDLVFPGVEIPVHEDNLSCWVWFGRERRVLV